MRTLIVDTAYPAFLRSLYERQPMLARQPYITQWRAQMDCFFGTADSYSHHLTGLGHESHEFIVNCMPLQRRWAAEHGVRIPSRLREKDERDVILTAQAMDFQPDVCYVQNLEALRPRTLTALRRAGILLVGQLSTEPPATRILRLFDLIVTPLPSLAELVDEIGVQAAVLPLAFDPRALGRLGRPPDEPSFDAVFVGSLRRFRRWKSNRIIEEAAHQVHIDFWGYGEREWRRSSPVRRNFHGRVWGLDMLRVLRDARVSINRHGDLTGPFAANMRLYEATGVGSMLLTDEKINLGDLFAPNTEVVTYRTAEELAEAVRYYLSAGDERAAIAAAGKKRTLQDHTYDRRMRQLVEIITGVAEARAR